MLEEDEKEYTTNWAEDFSAMNVLDYLEDAYYKKRKKIIHLLAKMPVYILNYRIIAEDVSFELVPIPKDKMVLKSMDEIRNIFSDLHKIFIEAHVKSKKSLSKHCIFKGYIEKTRNNYMPRERYWYIGKQYPSNKKKKLKTSNIS